MLTQSKAQTTGITEKKQKDILGIASKNQQRKEQTDHLVQKRRNPTTRISREKQTFRPDIWRPKVKEDPPATKEMRTSEGRQGPLETKEMLTSSGKKDLPESKEMRSSVVKWRGT
jgi:hypothetical protein